MAALTRRLLTGARPLARSVSVGPLSRSWVEYAPTTDFPIQNLPFGVFSVKSGQPRCATAIGDYVVDLAALANAGLLADLPFDSRAVFQQPALNSFMALPRPAWRATRARLAELLVADGGDDGLRRDETLRRAALRPLAEVTMHLPAKIGDYTDFYSSREHASNVGIMFRGPDNPLQPNWLHLPVGYHGRASSVVLTGTPVVRPRGQLQADKEDPWKGSVYGPSRLLDFELEIGMFVGGPTPPLGRPITMEEAEDYIFGLVLMNDWSARDIQAWEYVPLGPFGSKNFATTISPWVVSLDALEPFRCTTSAGPRQDPEPLPYIKDPNYSSYDIQLQVDLIPARPDGSRAAPTTISRSNFRHMYWNCKQQLVHHAVTGCDMHPGDLLGSGTISGTAKESFGSMLELTWRGRDDIALTEGGTRKFLADGDILRIRGTCSGPEGHYRIGFGDCAGEILPAGSYDAVARPAQTRELPFRDFVLHSYWRSSCSWRVRIALAYHGIEFQTKPVHLVKGGGEQNKTEYQSEVNPMSQVPALIFRDTEGTLHTVTQSLAIIDMLDALCAPGSPALVPPGTTAEGALRRAAVLQIAEIINSGIQPHQNLTVVKAIKTAVDPDGGAAETDGAGLARARIRVGLAACERLASVEGPFAAGAEVTLADLCIVPQLYSARRFGIDLSAYPRLLRAEAACAPLACFQAAHADAQPDAER